MTDQSIIIISLKYILVKLFFSKILLLISERQKFIMVYEVISIMLM